MNEAMREQFRRKSGDFQNKNLSALARGQTINLPPVPGLAALMHPASRRHAWATSGSYASRIRLDCGIVLAWASTGSDERDGRVEDDLQKQSV
jgi:hypothetical protein